MKSQQIRKIATIRRRVLPKSGYRTEVSHRTRKSNIFSTTLQGSTAVLHLPRFGVRSVLAEIYYLVPPRLPTNQSCESRDLQIRRRGVEVGKWVTWRESYAAISATGERPFQGWRETNKEGCWSCELRDAPLCCSAAGWLSSVSFQLFIHRSPLTSESLNHIILFRWVSDSDLLKFKKIRQQGLWVFAPSNHVTPAETLVEQRRKAKHIKCKYTCTEEKKFGITG